MLGWGPRSTWTFVAFLLQADELDGEIDLRCCTDVTEYAVQRNYGFQIHVRLRAGVGGGVGAACLEGPLGEVLVWSTAVHPETGSCHSFTQRPCPRS